MTPRLRKLSLTAHGTFFVGWLGAAAAWLALALTGLMRQDAQLVRAASPCWGSSACCSCW